MDHNMLAGALPNELQGGFTVRDECIYNNLIKIEISSIMILKNQYRIIFKFKVPIYLF